MTIATYTYPANGRYNETVATLADGRMMTVDTQYGVVLPKGTHATDCDQRTKIGGRCNCGMLDGVDTDALIAEAREHGKFGEEPRPAAATDAPESPEWRSERGLTLTEEMDRDDTAY